MVSKLDLWQHAGTASRFAVLGIFKLWYTVLHTYRHEKARRYMSKPSVIPFPELAIRSQALTFNLNLIRRGVTKTR